MLLKIKEKSPDLISRIIYAIPMFAALYFTVFANFYLTVAVVVIVFLGVYAEWKKMESHCIKTRDVSYWFVAIKAFYVVIMQFIVFMMLYMHITGIWVANNGFGLALGVVVLSAAAVDAGAYFGGKFLSHYFPAKLAPNISKNKTIIGALCGFVAGYVTYVYLCSNFLNGFRFEVFHSIYVEGFLMALIPVFCDLLQSKAKREAGVKDSGTLLKDHGGLADRTDTIKPSIAIMLLLKFPF